MSDTSNKNSSSIALTDPVAEEQLSQTALLKTKSGELEEITFKFTRDPKLIKEYIELREILYEQSFGVKGKVGYDEYDNMDCSHTLVLTKGEKCIGGGRITVHKATADFFLPMECKDFKLSDVLPEFDLKNNISSEVTRVVVLPEYRSDRLAGNIYIMLNIKAAQHNVKYNFTKTPYKYARSYRMICNKLGIKTKILSNIKVPYKKDYPKNENFMLEVFHVNPDITKINGGINGIASNNQSTH